MPKAKRPCPFHNTTGTLELQTSIRNLPVDYLATDAQKMRMVEILERSSRNLWTGRVTELKHAMLLDDADLVAARDPNIAADKDADIAGAEASATAGTQTATDASVIRDKGKGKEVETDPVQLAPASATTPSFPDPVDTGSDDLIGFGLDSMFDDSEFSAHGYAFEWE